MKCCVQNCSNDDVMESNKTHRITFQMSSDNSSELKVCRVCLALDVKMYDLKDLTLSERFQNITGILACHKESALHHVCWECAARLSAAAAFRDKALLSDALLKDVQQLNDIAAIKETHSFLKSSLTIQRVFTTSTIESEGAKDTLGNIVKNRNKTGRKTKRKMNQEENVSPEHEPWIDVPMNVDIEPDPIADNSIPIKEEENDIFLEETHFQDEDIEEQVDNSDTITKETKMGTDPMVNDDDDIDLVDHEEEKPKLDIIVDNVDESSDNSSGENVECEVSIHEIKNITSNKLVKRKVKIRNNDRIKEKIIELKKNRASTVEIAKKTGASVASINSFWKRYRKSGTGQSLDKETDTKATQAVRRRLTETGLKHVFMTRPVIPKEMKLNMSNNKVLHDDLKQRIITLKQEGLATRRVADLLNTSRNTVRKWWARWSNEGHMNNIKVLTCKKRKTTPQDDQRLIERVMQEPSVHTPSLAKELGVSSKCVRNRLKEAGFKLMQKKAIVPLRSGRCHKVDEDTKQQIISMKQNGVSVTDIANQFRVTRTSVYRWWQQWCKENNVKLTSNRKNTSTEQDQSVTEDSDVRNSTQAPTVISSYKSEWRKLPDVEPSLSPLRK